MAPNPTHALPVLDDNRNHEKVKVTSDLTSNSATSAWEDYAFTLSQDLEAMAREELKETEEVSSVT